MRLSENWPVHGWLDKNYGRPIYIQERRREMRKNIGGLWKNKWMKLLLQQTDKDLSFCSVINFQFFFFSYFSFSFIPHLSLILMAAKTFTLQSDAGCTNLPFFNFVGGEKIGKSLMVAVSFFSCLSTSLHLPWLPLLFFYSVFSSASFSSTSPISLIFPYLFPLLFFSLHSPDFPSLPLLILHYLYSLLFRFTHFPFPIFPFSTFPRFPFHSLLFLSNGDGK